MPCEGGEAVMLTSETRLNNIAVRVSTQIFKNLCHIGMTSYPIESEINFVHRSVFGGRHRQFLPPKSLCHETAPFEV